MAKRGLSLLLALATLFSLSVPAFAEEEAVTAEEVVTEEPVEEPEEVVEEAEAEPETAATSGTTSDGLTWEVNGTTLTISGTGPMSDYEYDPEYYKTPWPDTITSVVISNGVTSIGENAFREYYSLTSATIPGSVSTIGSGAFEDCQSLADLTIQSGVTSIGKDAFYHCASLTSVTIPNTVTSIGMFAFNDTGLRTITIPSSLTSIGDSAFAVCGSLTDVTIQEGVTALGDFMFSGCSSLISITVPASVADVGYSTFSNCASLTEINVAAGSSSYASVDGVLFNAIETELIAYPAGKNGSYTVPDGVTEIAPIAFSYVKSLTGVTIPGSVKAIGSQAFGQDVNLKSVTLSEGLKIIGYAAFSDCSSLTSVVIPKSVTRINDWAFSGCSNLASLEIRSMDCEVSLTGTENLGIPGKTVVSCYAGSKVETWALENGYQVEYLDPEPTATPEPTPEPTAEPTPEPTAEPTPVPTAEPTPVPTAEPTPEPTATPKPTNTPVPTATPQLAAPKVTISKVSNGIKVSWNKIAGSPRYMVYYKEGNGGWKKIGTTTSTTYTRAAKYLKNNVTYQFTVRCCENDKKTLLGPYKASNSLKYVGQLAAPTVKIAKVAGGIKVTWNKVSGSPRYMVYYKENGGSWKKIGTTTSTTYTRAAKYLKNNVTYQFTVRCCANDKKTLLGPYKASTSLKYKK